MRDLNKMQKAAEDLVKQNQEAEEWELLTDSGQSAEGSSGQCDTETIDITV
jgi:hypothetical protein